MRTGGPRTDVCIRDVSSKGMLVQASAPPARGTYVEIICDTQTIVGRVAWRKERRFGLHASHRIDVRALADRLPPAANDTKGGAPSNAPTSSRPAETSRLFAKTMEFGAVGVGALLLVALLGAAAFETLSKPLSTVANILAN